MEYLMVFIGGFLGAISRYSLSNIVKRFVSIDFPISTLIINGIGSFLIGILISVQAGDFTQLLLGTGFMGGFTTFSTFQMENVKLIQNKNYRTLILYVFASIFFCILFALLGLIIGKAPIKTP